MEDMKDFEVKNIVIELISLIVVIAIILGIISLFGIFRTVPSGHIGIKTKFGEVQNDTLQEGLNTKIPFIEKIIKIDCRTQKCEYSMEASSKDLQKISNIKIAVNYNVDKNKASSLYKEVGIDFKGVIIEPAIFEIMKSAISNYTAEQLVTKRQEVSNLAQETLTNRLKNRGIIITSLNMTDLSFSKEFDEAIEKKQIVEQQTQQAKYELEKAKVENKKKIENAKAEAEVMKQQNKEITKKALELKKLEVYKELIKKWNGVLPTTTTSNNIPILDLIK